YAQEDAEVANFENANREYIARSLKLVRLMGMLWPSLEFVVALAIPLTLLFGGREVLEHRLTPGQFLTFLLLIVQMTWPIIALGWVINIFQRGTASLKRIDQILQELPEVVDEREPLVPYYLKGEIEFRGLNFSYNGTPVLHDINLRIPAG